MQSLNTGRSKFRRLNDRQQSSDSYRYARKRAQRGSWRGAPTSGSWRDRPSHNPLCLESYVGYTTRNLCIRTEEHVNRDGPIKRHMALCKVKLDREKQVKVLESSTRDEEYLKVLESLWQHKLKPIINTNYEVKSRPLNIGLLSKV